MNAKFNSKFSFMGVLNVTPDSFSDGGELIQDEQLEERIAAWKAVGAEFFDIGAQSTAPMNPAIEADVEWRRLEQVIARIPKDIAISLDTYRANTVEKFNNLRPIVLWNDVSGQLDDELLSLLKKYPTLKTVYCHNLAPKRELCGSHMDYVISENVIESVHQKLADALKWYDGHGLQKPMLDPCFGFSKNHEQNWLLLKALPQLMADFEARHGAQEWIVGVSRKSFFKKLALASVDQDVLSQTEYMQAIYLSWLEQNLKSEGKIIVRMHDPVLAHALIKIGEKL